MTREKTKEQYGVEVPDMDLILEAARKKMVTLYKELKAEVGD